MALNPYEEELRRLTVLKSYIRKEIDLTHDMKKKEVLRKKYEDISYRLEQHLKNINIEMN